MFPCTSQQGRACSLLRVQRACRPALGLLSLFVALGTALADPTIQLPAAVQAKPGRLVRIEAKTDGKVVKWFVNDPDNADLIPIKAENAAIFCAAVPSGTFRVFAYTALADQPSDPAVCVVTVGTPTPPVPPTPPPPADPLQAALQAAYTADAAATKAVKKTALQAIYLVATSSANDTTLTTAGALYAFIDAKRGPMSVADTDLVSERQVIASWLASKWPAAQTLDAPTRTAMAAELTHVATGLGAVK